MLFKHLHTYHILLSCSRSNVLANSSWQYVNVKYYWALNKVKDCQMEHSSIFPTHYIANSWELIVGRDWFSSSYLHFWEQLFNLFFSVRIVSASLFWRVQQCIAVRAYMKMIFNFHHWIRRGYETKRKAKKLLTNNAWPTFLFLHKHNGDDTMVLYTGVFHGLLKNK